jgi:histidine triad (HIT) family protein
MESVGCKGTAFVVVDDVIPVGMQSVPHPHFHVIPRWGGDNFSTWPTSRSEHQVEGDPSSRLASTLSVERAL